MAGYSERRDATGSVTIEVKDTQILWVFAYAGCEKLLARINAALRR